MNTYSTHDFHFFGSKLFSSKFLTAIAALLFSLSCSAEQLESTVVKPVAVEQAAEQKAQATQVTIETTQGNITLELFDEKSPITVKNFLSYVDANHYDATIFHRVIRRFMIQGGGFTDTMQEKPVGEPIKNESKNRVHNERGTIAMARTSDPDSATAQFYINLKMNVSLDYRQGQAGYAVFGKVIEGMDVVDTISLQATTSVIGHNDVPQQNILINRIVRVEPAGAAAKAENSDTE